MKCPNCETENREGAKFCDECGFPLTGAIARAAVAISGDESAGSDSQPPKVDEAPSDSNDEIDIASENENQPLPDAPNPQEEQSDDLSSEELDECDTEPGDEQEQETSGDAPDTTSEINLADDNPTVEKAEAEPRGFNSDPAQTADLAGFDNHVDEYGERLVSPDYRPPEANFRDGGTIEMPRLSSDEPPKSKDYLASSTKSRKKPGKLVAIIIVALVAVAALAAFGTYQMQLWGGKVVPDVVGMTEADARSVLTDQGFAVRSEQVKSDDTEGLVLIMDPSAGSRTAQGEEVTIHIASTRTVPDVTGKKKEDAASILAEAGYENVQFEEEPSDKTKGTVLSMSPKAGERAKSTAEITVSVAKPYSVPDVTGKDLSDAIDAIEKAGLKYESVDYETSEYPEGAVVGTEPEAGTEVEKGDYIVIYVAQARGAHLESLVEEQLGEGSTVDSGGKSYMIESLDAVAYLGNDMVSYTATAREYISVFGQTVSSQQTESISGTVVFNEDDEIIAIS